MDISDTGNKVATCSVNDPCTASIGNVCSAASSSKGGVVCSLPACPTIYTSTANVPEVQTGGWNMWSASCAMGTHDFNVDNVDPKKIISSETSSKLNKILRKVVAGKEGTASLANIYGYDVGGKTGTSQKYGNENENLNTFISIFPAENPKYVLLVMLENPKVASDLIYNYRGMKIKGTRNEAGWNSVYTAGQIIKKIGPILAIKNEEFYYKYAAKKSN